MIVPGTAQTVSHTWVIVVAGHVVAPDGNEFFYDTSFNPHKNHDTCVKKAAELSSACTKVDEEPPVGTRAHWEWEQAWCIPGYWYIVNGNDRSGKGCTPDPNVRARDPDQKPPKP